MAARVHPFPYRTRKLSSLVSKILGWKRPGKIERCQHLVGVDGDEGTPVPIPNTEVKLISVEDTWLETARENRKMPTSRARPIGRAFSFAIRAFSAQTHQNRRKPAHFPPASPPGRKCANLRRFARKNENCTVLSFEKSWHNAAHRLTKCPPFSATRSDSQMLELLDFYSRRA